MKFLNQKEDVIDLEITPYGKKLLSMGNFLPEYYAFHDDEIMYDSRYASVVENQNSASVRIKEVPQLQTQTYFYSAEKQVKEATAFQRLTKFEKENAVGATLPMDINGKPYVQDDMVTIGVIPDRSFNKEPIGNSALNSIYAPAWDVNVIEGQILSSSQTLGGLQVPIPQLNMKASMVQFSLTTAPVGGNFYEFDSGLQPLPPDSPLKNKFFNVLEKSLILEIEETNTTYEWENFDIEVFEVEKLEFPGQVNIGGGTTKEFLKPLFFQKNVSNTKQELLLDSNQVSIDNVPLTPQHAGYFLDINIDDEIDIDLLCGRAKNKAGGLFTQRLLNCEERAKQEEVSIEDLYNPDNIVIVCPEGEE